MERSPGHSIILAYEHNEESSTTASENNSPFSLQNVTPPLTLLTTMIGMDCEVTESVVFHPVDWIYNSISWWIITTAVDFNPHKDALFAINQYALKVKQSLFSYSESFHSSNSRYSLLLNMTDEMDSVLCKITSNHIEAFNLIDHIHKPKDIRTKRSLPAFGGLFHFLFGTANDDGVRSMKQAIQKLYDNQISQSKVLNDVISISNISRG